jgi:hypothetical protein
MRKRHRYTGEAIKDRGVLKFKLMQDGIFYGFLTPLEFYRWQERQKTENARPGGNRKRAWV